MTFMGYMTDVTAGGFTVFPALGLFVEPAKGDALLWMTEKNDLVSLFVKIILCSTIGCEENGHILRTDPYNDHLFVIRAVSYNDHNVHCLGLMPA